MGRHKKQQYKESRFTGPKLNLAQDTKRGVAVVVFMVLGLLFFLSAFNLAGSFGQFLFGILKWIFGVLAYVVPFVLFLVAILLAKQKLPKSQDGGTERKSSFYWRIYLGALLFVGSIAGLADVFYLQNNGSAWALARIGKAGGFLGAIFGGPAHTYLGFWAASVVLLALLVIAILVIFNIPLRALWPKSDFLDKDKPVVRTQLEQVKINSMGKQGFISEKVVDKNQKLKLPEATAEALKGKTLASEAVINQRTGREIKLDAITTTDRKDWKLPNFDLLDDSQTTVDSGNIEANVAIIKKTLADFGIEVEMGEVNVGPTVTQYTLRPAIGVKLSQIATLQNDLALALAAHSIRMELPIPGKSLVGIEVPNKATAIVRLREVMQTHEFIDHKSKLALALGRDVAGKAMVTDLDRMPHLLIAGATGTGKSVAINSLFVSLLYRNTPQDVKFIVIDPKRVELNLYNGIPHLLTPVVIDYEKAVNALKWAVAEMDRRYKLLSEADKRNIIEYNESAASDRPSRDGSASARARQDSPARLAGQDGSGLALPYIVIFVDELADLMAVAQADVEAAIVRLAQMARAVGIHLVVATQRPSVDIITGLIKANITSRIAFAVASQIDSRTILDTAGAEKLLGNGDMLFIAAEFNKPKRIQGAFIGEKEVRRVVEFFKNQAGAVIYNEQILEKPKKPFGVAGFGWEEEGDDDPLLQEAIEEVKRAGKASASLLQRRLRIGYARAARILDILERKGLIGPGEGAKPREVFGVIPAGEREEYGVEENVE